MLSFDPLNHVYKLDGVVLPSVTQILDNCSLIPYYPAEQKSFYLARGRAVHEACALLVKGQLDLASTDRRIHGFIESYRKFLARTGFQPDLVEESVWSKSYRVAGTLDLQGPLNNIPTIIDIKSGEPADSAELQTAAYCYLLKESHGISVQRRLTLRLHEDGEECRPDEYFDLSDDIRVFLSATAVWHWRNQRKLIK